MKKFASRLFNLRRVLGIAAFALTAAHTPAHASFGVMPREVQLPAEKGARVSDEVEVYNGSEETLRVSASAIDWKMGEVGDVQFSEAGTTPRSCAKWVQFNPTDFSLEPKKSVRVRISATVPDDFTEECWAMIFFTSRPMPVKGDQFQLNISMRVGCKLFITPSAAPAATGRIVDMNLLTKSGPQVEVAFENTSARQLRVQGKVELRDEAGSVVATGELQPQRAQILSRTKRQILAALDKPLAPGTYRVKAVLDYGAKALSAGEMKVKIANAVPLPAPPAETPAAPTAAPAPATPTATPAAPTAPEAAK